MNKSQNLNVFSTFHCHKLHLIALLDLFTDPNDRFPYSSVIFQQPFLVSSYNAHCVTTLKTAVQQTKEIKDEPRIALNHNNIG